MRPRLLDLFCGAGGCSVGYERAGFEVVGVDIKPQPNYPFKFYRMDALDVLNGRGLPLIGYHAIHASPPCQAHVKGLAAVNRTLGRELDHHDLIAATRERLIATGLPYVIENVEGAPLRNPVRLCGSSFGLAVQRHRLFETTVAVMALPCAHHLQTEPQYWTSWRPNGQHRLAKVVQVYGNAGDSTHWAEAMGINWMDRAELTEAIPPAYAEYIGGYLAADLRARGVAA